MKRIHSSDSDVLEWESGGGSLLALGMFFLFFGLLLCSIPFTTTEGVAKDRWVFFVVGLVFTLLGLICATGRRGMRLDTRRHQLSRWWGLLLPFSQKVSSLDSIREIRVTRKITRSDKRNQTFYEVALVGEGLQIELYDFNNAREARKCSEDCSKALRCPIVDSSSGNQVRRESEFLDESVRDRILRLGEEWTPPVPSVDSCIQIQEEGEGLKIKIPPSGMKPLHFMIIGFMCIMPLSMLAVFILPQWLNKSSGPPLFFMIFAFVAFGMGPIGIGSFVALFLAKRSWELHLTKDELMVTYKTLIKKKIRFKTEEVEAFELNAEPPPEQLLISKWTGIQSRGIAIVSDDQSLNIGNTLSYKDASYLHAKVMSYWASL